MGATRVKENTLDPVWNEIFYAVCYSRREPLTLELMDWNNLKKDRSLGGLDIKLSEVLTFDVIPVRTALYIVSYVSALMRICLRSLSMKYPLPLLQGRWSARPQRSNNVNSTSNDLDKTV
jgi:hypothetical protein